MSARMSVDQLQDCLPELIDRIVKTDEDCVVQRNGKDCAVIVSARKWRGRRAALQLDALGPAYRLSLPKQARMEQLVETKHKRSLTPAEQRELRRLLRDCDAIMMRRAEALERLL